MHLDPSPSTPVQEVDKLTKPRMEEGGEACIFPGVLEEAFRISGYLAVRVGVAQRALIECSYEYGGGEYSEGMYMCACVLKWARG